MEFVILIQKRLFMLLVVLMFMPEVKAYDLKDSVTTISMQAITGLQYDLVRFRVKPGEKVRLTFTNTDDMGHNLLITKPGARMRVVEAALQLAEKGPAMDYIPKTSDVLWAIPVVYKGETQTVTFTAPKATGAYPYVCTYPGHGYVMYGVMYVTTAETLPDIKNDPHIPESRRQEKTALHQEDHAHDRQQEQAATPLHPYEPVAPYCYRVFIEGASLAAIAVHLPQELSYCWDAGTCHLRFAWEGEFLDNTDLWHGHKNAYAKIMGTVFYRDKTDFPIRLGTPETIPVAAYKGYRLADRYPEFHYTLNGIAVYELIKPKADGSGFIRTIRMPDAAETVWFVSHPEDGVDYACSTGQWEHGMLKLTPRQAKAFTITMTKTSKLP